MPEGGVVDLVHRAGAAPPEPRYTRDPVLAGLTLTAACATAWVLLGPGGFTATWLVQIALDVVFIIGCARVARLAGPGSARRFWRAMSLGGVMFALADTYQTLVTLHASAATPANSTVQTILVACGVACVVWVMLTHPLDVTDQERLRLWLDSATIMVAVAVFAWTLVVNTGRAGDIATGLLGAGLMLVCAFGVVKLLLSGTAPFTLRAGIIGGFAAALIGVGTSLNPLLSHTGHPQLVTVARLLPCVLMAATPRVQELQMRAQQGSPARRRRPYSRIPYVAVAATQILVLSVFLGEGLSSREWGMLAGFSVITTLVVVRQLIAFHDNSRLLGRLSRQEERFRSLVQHASDITLVIDAQGLIQYVSPALYRVLRIPPDQATGTQVLKWIHPNDLSAARDMMGGLLADRDRSVAVQVRSRDQDSTWRWLEVIGTNLLDNPSVGGIVLNARDVTESRQLHERLHHDANHDPLTQLANRALFAERLRLVSLATPSGTSPGEVAVIAIDLNKFKHINDTLGHHVGDGLLIAVAERLRPCVRPADTVARLGGDEFAVLLPNTSRSGAHTVLQRIGQAFAEPAEIDGHTVPISASLGLAVGSPHQTPDLLREADAAMYAEKRRTAQPATVAGGTAMEIQTASALEHVSSVAAGAT